MSNFTEIRAHTGRSHPKHFKATLFSSSRLMLGVNCLEPGQVQRVHTHEGQDKFYVVLEGTGSITVGDEVQVCSAGKLAWAPAGVEHGVENTGDETLVLFMGIAPAPGGAGR